MDVVVNAATSADGKLSTRERRQIRISGESDFARVDRLRAASDAILVGVGTVLADDPSLTRHDREHRRRLRERGTVREGPPARVVADSRGRTPLDAEILEGEPPTLVFVSEAAPDERRDALAGAGASVHVAGDERVDLASLCETLAGTGAGQLMVEGGGELVYSLFEAGLVDRLSTFVGPLVIGGRDAPTLADGEGFTGAEGFRELRLDGVDRFDGGVLLEWDVVD
ncbi:2,5-diamino-6-(ribosylamino)-4(3H)-pyrimidinone 5'-phosphate reductase [Halobacteriales archaeon QS_5_70_15]|nr:MAG: 2,5-diamino-6-(ribosylamino)-4(3H)-pyrimidinone 5'-phosphate reductase [Halobacteriales archaeon QS_5_70_15]